MTLTVNGQNTTSVPAGANVTMLCSAQSSPPAQLQWAVRGELVNITGQFLELFNVSEDQNGPYSCLAFNSHTNMSSNITKYITIASELFCIMMSFAIFSCCVFAVSSLLGFVSTELSGSERQTVCVSLLTLLLLLGFFL